MATALDIITDALADIGVASPGETVSTEDRAIGLSKLNRLLSSWTAEKIAVAGINVLDFTSTGAETYTFGSGGSGSTTRPVAVVAVGVLNGGRAAAAEMVDAAKYNAILDKSRSGIFAEAAYYNAGFPLGTLYLTPKPLSGGTIRIHNIQPATVYAAVTDTVTLAPGYERAVVANLALDLAPAFGAPGGAPQLQLLMAIAKEAKQAVQMLSAEAIAGSAAALAHAMSQAQGGK